MDIRFALNGLCRPFAALAVALLCAGSAIGQVRIVVNADLGRDTISRHIYGHFSEHLGRCIYGGYFVGEGQTGVPNTRGIRTDVVDALKRIRIPNLRWPGGCFADTYHWKDGIGRKEQRPSIVNSWWGGVTENNSFGTHEFLDLCTQLGAEPYISGNVGSGTVQELAGHASREHRCGCSSPRVPWWCCHCGETTRNPYRYFLALRNTALNIGRVSFPVKVFC